jgi:glycosyltransferase involved in cell wall biosynthesis
MEKIKPKVSIIITTYNRAQELAERSLPSALKQTYPNFECIVVDDCSTDETPKVIKDFIRRGAKIRYLKLKKNRGCSGARNYGAEHAKGDFIVFLDDDNELFPNFLEITVQKLTELPEDFGAVFCGRIVQHKKLEEYRIPSSSKSFYAPIDWGWLLRKRIFSKIKYDKEIHGDDDTDFGIQFFKYYKAYGIDKPLQKAYTYLLNEKSEPSECLPSQKRLQSLDKFLKKNISIYKQKGTKNELAYIYRFAGRNYCQGRQMKKGISFLWKSLLIKPTLRTLFNLTAACLGSRVYSFYWWKLERGFIAFIRSKLSTQILKSQPKEKNGLKDNQK